MSAKSKKARRTVKDVMEMTFDVTRRYQPPEHFELLTANRAKWLLMLAAAERLVAEDVNWQERCAKGLTIKGRPIPAQLLGRLYAQYCALINKMYDAYSMSLQLQKQPYIMEIISILLKRMYELRNELMHYIVNDYIYVDESLEQLFMTPFDIQIIVPYHYAVDSRPDSIEGMLQKMWRHALKRKLKIMAKPKPQKLGPVFSDPKLEKLRIESKRRLEEAMDEEDEDEDEDSDGDVPLAGQPQVDVTALIIHIQRHERYRRFYKVHFLQMCNYRRTYFGKLLTIVAYSDEVRERAAKFMQKAYRFYMKIKRRRILEHRRDVVLGLVPDFERRPKTSAEEKAKLFERHDKQRKTLEKDFFAETEKKREAVLFMRKDEHIENITEEVRAWFKEWYHGYGFFPQYPYPLEGGTVMVIRGDYPTFDEQKEEDEKRARMTKGKTADQLRQERKQAKLDAILKKEQAIEREKKERLNLMKAKTNPLSDPGYTVKQSELKDNLSIALRKYRQAWSIYDRLPVDRMSEVAYGFIKPVITEDVMKQMHLECREIVDEMMRLELKVFIKAHQEMYRELNKKFPKRHPRPRPRSPSPLPTPVAVSDDVLKSLEKLFDLEIISKPKTKLNDIIGDMSFVNYYYNVQDPNATFPPPAYGDVKRRLMLSCVLGSGMEPGAERQRAVMLLGPASNGKSFLADAVAGEINAVKIDISPPVFSAKVRKINKIMNLVLLAARTFQPTVIFIKNVEKVFYKKVPPKEKSEKARTLATPLKNLMKHFPITEKIILIATCSDPWAAKMGPMMKIFSQKILVPLPDYNTLQMFFYNKFQKMIAMPRDHCTHGLAQVLQGIPFGVIMKMCDEVLSAERIVKLAAKPLREAEFVEYLIENDIEPLTELEYKKYQSLVIEYSPLKEERLEYNIINIKRADAYLKLAKAEESKKAKQKKA